MEEPLELYRPALSELWFRQRMMADPATMSYNIGWNVGYAGYHRETGCIDFPASEWAGWYARWMDAEPERFYAYLRRRADGAFLGEVDYHITPERDWWDMGVVLFAPYRGKGYAAPALRLLARQAFGAGVTRLHNEFELARGETAAWRAHRAAGFRDAGTANGVWHVLLTRADWEAARRAGGAEDCSGPVPKEKE